MLELVRIAGLRHQQVIVAAFQRVGAALDGVGEMRVREVRDENRDDSRMARAQTTRRSG